MGLKFNAANHRYRLDSPTGVEAWVPGVTTLLGNGIPKPALMPWYARKVAEYVDSNPEEIERLRGLPPVDHRGRQRSALVNELVKVPIRERDQAAARGTEIHALAERIVNGEEVEVPPEHLAEVQGYVRFLDAWNITPVLTETLVANRTHWYAGTLDMIATSPHLADGKPVMVDLKTANGVYGEVALQCAAYARAEFHTSLDDLDTEHPMPEIAATYVAHITPEGTRLHELCKNPAEITEAFNQFQAAAYVAKTAKRRDAYIKDPLPEPEQENTP